MNTEQKVIHEIANQLGLNESEITPESTFHELNIDSLDHVEMVMALEDDFHIEINDSDCDKWQTVGDVIEHMKGAK